MEEGEEEEGQEESWEVESGEDQREERNAHVDGHDDGREWSADKART